VSKQTAANLHAACRIFYFASTNCETGRPAFYLGFHCLNQRHVEEPSSSLDPEFVFVLSRQESYPVI